MNDRGFGYLAVRVFALKIITIAVISIALIATGCSNSGSGKPNGDDSPDITDPPVNNTPPDNTPPDNTPPDNTPPDNTPPDNNPPDNNNPPPVEDVPATDGLAQKITRNEDLHATSSTPATVFNVKGDGLAVWIVTTGSARKLQAATYTSSSQAWSAPRTLVIQHGSTRNRTYFNLADDKYMAATDNELAVTWAQDGKIIAEIFNVTSGKWKTTTVSTDVGAGLHFTVPRITANATMFAVAWTNSSDDFAYASIYQDDTWRFEPFVLATPVDDVGTFVSIARDIFIEANNAQLALMWTSTLFTPSDIVHAVTISTFSINVEKAWKTPVNVGQMSEPENINDAQLFANGSQFLVSWIEENASASESFNLVSALFDGSVWQDAVVVNNAAQTVLSSSRHFVAFNDFGMMFLWLSAGDSNTNIINATVFLNGAEGGWQPVKRLSADSSVSFPIGAAANNTGFAALWREVDLTSGGSLFKTQRFVNNAWVSQQQELSIDARSADTINTAILAHNDVFYAVIANQNTAIADFLSSLSISAAPSDQAWTEPRSIGRLHQLMNGPSAPEISMRKSAWLGWAQFEPENADLPSYPVLLNLLQADSLPVVLQTQAMHAGGILAPLITNAQGRGMAMLVQYDTGFFRKYAGLRVNGEWSAPELIEIDNRHFRSRYDYTMARDEISLASTGNTFCLAWKDFNAVAARVHDGAQWLTPGTVVYDGYNFLSFTMFAYQDDCTLLVEVNNSSAKSRKLLSYRFNDDQWHETELLTWDTSNINVHIDHTVRISAGATDEFMAVWIEEDLSGVKKIMARLNKAGARAGESTPVQQVSNDFTVRDLKVTAVSQENYVVSYNRMKKTGTERILEVYAYSPQQTPVWENVAAVQNVSDYVISADLSKVMLVYLQNAVLNSQHRSVESGEWSPLMPLMENISIQNGSLQLAANAGKFAVVWNSAVQSRFYYSVYSQGAWAVPTASSIDPIDIPNIIFKQTPFISAYRDNFALSWSETNILEDASISYVSAQMGGF